MKEGFSLTLWFHKVTLFNTSSNCPVELRGEDCGLDVGSFQRIAKDVLLQLLLADDEVVSNVAHRTSVEDLSYTNVKTILTCYLFGL